MSASGELETRDVFFDLVDADDPAPILHRLRDEDPVHLVEPANPGWVAPFFPYLVAGSNPALLGLALLSAACASALVLGWRTRLATLGCWFLLVSLQTRNPLALSYEHHVLRLLLFFSLFTKLHAKMFTDVLLLQPVKHLSGGSIR